MSDLVVVDAVPKLANFELSAEEAAGFEELFLTMTEPPMGLDAATWDWKPDVIKIKTATTGDPQCPANADLGDIWSAGQVLWSAEDDGKKNPWGFIPIFHHTSHAMFEQRSNVPVCSSPNGETARNGLKCAQCEHLPWKGSAKLRPGNPRTACNRSQEFIVLASDLSGIYRIRFSSSSEPAGNNILQLTKRRLWGRIYGLHTIETTKGSNTWSKYQTVVLDTHVPPAVAAFCEFAWKHAKAAQDERLAEMYQSIKDAEAVLDGEIDELDELEAELLDGDVDFSSSM